MKAMQSRPHADPRERQSSRHRFDDEIDDTLLDLFLEQSLSDRLRSLCAYVNALSRFRPV